MDSTPAAALAVVVPVDDEEFTPAASAASASPRAVPSSPKKQPPPRFKKKDEDFNKTLLQQPRREFATVEELEQYLRENPTVLAHPDDVAQLVEEAFPLITSTPLADDVDRSLTGQGNGDLAADSEFTPFAIGDWAERLGDDMQWHFEPIRRIVRLEDQEGEVFYRFESGVLVNSRRVRCSEEAVRRVFGMRPLLWQQWALLRLESKLRFQPDHENDFDELDFEVQAERMWLAWLGNPHNAEFRALHDAHAAHVQHKLRVFLFSPFVLCRRILKDKQEWDFENSDCSAYQYASFLGSGFVTCLVCMFLQFVVPFMILLYTIRVSTNFPYFTMLPNSSSIDMERILSTSWQEFCGSTRAFDAVMMNYVIFLVYVIRVIPTVTGGVYDTLGDSSSLRARANSLRLLSWLQGDDTGMQKLGFKMDRYMNSVYLALTSLVMMFALFLTNNTVDIILNALAVEFITGFDEEVAAQKWFDGGKRFLRASVVECEIRATMRLEYLHNAESFCEYYDCSLDEYNAKVNGPLYDPQQSARDQLLPEYMGVKERIWFSSAIVARDTGRKSALWQFEEQMSTFGIVDYALGWVNPGLLTGIFERYPAYCAWSKWDHALFLPRVPPYQQKKDKSTATGAGEAAAAAVANFDADSMSHPYVRFLWALVEALAFGNLVHITKTIYRRGEYLSLPLIMLDSLFEWCCFVFLLVVFPAGLAFYSYLVVDCQPIMYNTSAEDSLLYSTDYNFGR